MISLDPDFIGGVVHRKRALLQQQQARAERNVAKRNGGDGAEVSSSESSSGGGGGGDIPSVKLKFGKKVKPSMRESLKRKMHLQEAKKQVSLL